MRQNPETKPLPRTEDPAAISYSKNDATVKGLVSVLSHNAEVSRAILALCVEHAPADSIIIAALSKAAAGSQSLKRALDHARAQGLAL